MKHILRLPTKSNLHPQKIALKVRRDGPQPSIFVRSFSAITRSARASIPSMRAATLRLHQEFANAGDHLCTVKLDSGHEGLMRETSHTVFQVEAGRAESGEICSHFLGDGLWRPHVERSPRRRPMKRGCFARESASAALASAADNLPV